MKGGTNMKRKDLKGYPVSNGYMGLTDKGWMKFETEGAYNEYMEDRVEDD